MDQEDLTHDNISLLSNHSKIRILRYEIAKIIAKNKRLKVIDEDLMQKQDRLNIVNTELRLEIID